MEVNIIMAQRFILNGTSYHGKGAIKEIATEAISRGFKKAFVCSDPDLIKFGVTKKVLDVLDENGLAYEVYSDIKPNPTVENVKTGVQAFKDAGTDYLIAIGGGSSMDCAKAVGACIARPKTPLMKMKGILKVIRPLPPLFAVPTTAGTGSETTLAAVITDAKTRVKYPINDFPLIPRYAVLDPEVTRSLPPFITASTGLDALTHAVEAYIGRSTTKKTRNPALKAVQLIFANLQTAYHDGNNMTARKNMLHASYYAGVAFTISYVGYVHAVAHSLGGKYNIPHGLANAVLLPIVLRDYAAAAQRKLHDLANAAGLSDENDTDCVAAEKFICAIEGMLDEFSLGRTLAGIKAEDIPELARHADAEGNPLYPVPVLMNAKELEHFYHAVSQ